MGRFKLALDKHTSTRLNKFDFGIFNTVKCLYRPNQWSTDRVPVSTPPPQLNRNSRIVKTFYQLGRDFEFTFSSTNHLSMLRHSLHQQAVSRVPACNP